MKKLVFKRNSAGQLFKRWLLMATVLLPIQLLGQTITVSGTVFDNHDAPLIGAMVKVSGTTTGGVTDINGKFSIPKVPANGSLEVTFMGMKPQRVAVNGLTSITIKMEQDNSLIEEVVVVGYGVAKKSDLTGSVTSIKPIEREASNVASVDALLQGKVAGMNVVSSTAGGPGAANSVTIRGASSLRGDNQPLYVIDNIPQASAGEFSSGGKDAGDVAVPQNPLLSLNPNDIESVQVLKDASATAIYGSRGANGVIIITTKKGRAGKAKVNFSASYSVDEVQNLPKMLDLDQFIGYKAAQLGSTVSNNYFKVGDEVRYTYNPEGYDANDSDTYSLIHYKDWQNEVYRKVISQNYNLSVNGGSDKTTYFLSGSYKDLNGIVKNTGTQLGSFRLNLKSELSDKLTIGISLNGSLRKSNMSSGGNARGGVTGSIVDASLFASPYEIPLTDPVWSTSDLASLEARTTPLSWLTDYDDITNEKVFRGSAELTWKILPSLYYTLRTGGNVVLQDRKRWFGLQTFRGFNDNGYLESVAFNRDNYSVENLLNYNVKMGERSNLSAMVGTTYDVYTSLNSVEVGKDFSFRDLRTKGMSLARLVNIQQPLQADYQLLSYLSRLNLNLMNDKILLTATLRADGSSKFSSSNRWGYFPSAALAYRLDKETFLKNVKWVNRLKLRGGYGVTGNQSISPYSTLDVYGQGYYANNAGEVVNGLIIGSRLPNKDIKWETTSSYNIGVDFEMFTSRLKGAVDVYSKVTNDLLIQKNIPQSTGYNTVITNQGSLSNKGVDIFLDGDIIRLNDMHWSLSGNISFNNPIIQKLGIPEGTFGNQQFAAFYGNSIGDDFGIGNIFIEGKAPGLFWGYKTAGIYQPGEAIVITKDLNGSVPAPGDIKFVDQNGDNVIDDKDQVIIGNPNPKFTYGFQSSFRFKQLTLSAAFTGVYGNDILNTNIRYEGTPSRSSNTIRQDVFSKMYTNEAPSLLQPNGRYQIPNKIMDRYVENGSYLRWSDLTLAYRLSDLASKKLSVRGVNLSVSVKNLLLITSYSGRDPEVNSFAFDGLRPGIDYKSFPNSRTYILGVSIDF